MAEIPVTQQPGPLPGYTAGSSGRRLRMWRVPQMGPNTVNVTALSTLVTRSRGSARNDPWAGAANDKLVSNMIGTGVQMKARFGTPEARAAEKKVWDRWMKVCDADGVLDGYGQQALAAREWDEAGEVFARLRKRRPEDGLPVPLQVQMIEAEQCPCDMYRTASNGNDIRAGIEFNLIGQRVAYWFYRVHPGEVSQGGTQAFNSADMTRVPAEEIIHLYEPLRAGQLRGIPRAASVLTNLFNLDKFSDNVLERQSLANLFMGFYTRDAGTDDGLNGPLGEVATGSADDGTPLAGMEPGTMQELPEGMKVDFNDPPDAGANYPTFLRTQLLAIAARHGVPYEVLTGDLNGVSDRALKLILNEFRRIIEQRQWLYFIPKWCQNIREAYYDAGVLAGAIDAPNYATLRDEYVDTLWVPQGWAYSHPVQDITADIAAIRAGIKSRTSTILANGDDPEQITAEIVADNAVADVHDLIFDTDPRYTSDKGITQAKPAGSIEPSTEDGQPQPDPNQAKD